MLFSNWNDSLEMKQFGMNQYLFPNAKMWFCSKRLCNSRSEVEEHSVSLYIHTHTHAHSAHLQHVMLFIPAGWKHNPKILENWDAVNDILQLLKMSNTNKTQIFFPVKVGLREWKVHLLSSVKPQIRHSFSFPVSKWSQRHFSSK